MRLEAFLQADRLSIRAFARSAANDNLSFAERVKAAVAEAASAAGVSYSEHELARFAAEASEVATSLRRRLAATPAP